MNAPAVDPRARLAAADMILSRGWGRPKETHVVEDAEGREALSKITWEIVHVG
jgi:hypothetical protein